MNDINLKYFVGETDKNPFKLSMRVKLCGLL